jgi:uncharacterized spore protein YtfJ
MSMDAEKLLGTALGEIKRVVTANIVVGDPLSFEGKTILPVVGMSVDFGGGSGGPGMGKGTGEGEASEGADSGSGGGAGCGFTVKPVALIIIDKEEARIEQLKVKHLKFERFPSQSPYQPPTQPPSEESSRESEVADSDLAKEVSQLRKDIKELQAKLE